MDHPDKIGRSLGALALIKNEGKPSGAIADLLVATIGMFGFLQACGTPKEKVMEAFEEMITRTRECLVDILEGRG